MNGDLHIHTNMSDGALPPAAVADRVVASALGFFSVTDHNSLAGLAPVREALPEGQTRFIYGVELSAQPKDGEELHILGYGVDRHCEELNDACRRINVRKRAQFHEMVDRLRQDGVDVDLQGLPSEDEGAYFGRPLLAKLLIENGIVRTLRQAFAHYLGRGAPAHVQMEHFSPARCIDAIHHAGGLAVLAHPTIEMVDRWIERLADVGLDGVEAFRPALTGNEQLYVEKVAEHFGLFVTGGSDWHGREGEAALGQFTVSEEQIRGFFAALASREDAPGGRSPARQTGG
ncbi:MAG: PHP domain-containing protein [Planctomycetota bacterium]